MLSIILSLLFVPQGGILPPWESKTVLEHTKQQTTALTAALAQLDTEHWKGDYTPIVASTRRRVLAVTDALDRIIQKPESLSLAFETFLSLQHLEVTLDSLAQGAERYQPDAVRGLDQAGRDFVKARDGFQNYLLDLARYLEQNQSVDRKELETCRDQLWKRAPGKKVSDPVRRFRR